MNDSTRQILLHHPRSSSPYVFPGRSGGQRNNITKALNKIKNEAGLSKDFRPLHGLRHVFASLLVSSGQVDLFTLQKLLTHKSLQMSQRYAHLRDDALKRASSVVDDIMTDIADGKNIDTKQNQ